MLNIKELKSEQLINLLWDKTFKFDETPEEKTEVRKQIAAEISAINREINRRNKCVKR